MTGYRVRSDIQLPLPTAIWVLAAHAIALFIPFVLIVAVNHHWAALQELTDYPVLFYVAAGVMMAGSAFEIAQNAVDKWYLTPATGSAEGTGFCDGMFFWLIVASQGLVLYTDGIAEAINPGEEEYGRKRLAKVCVEHRSESASDLAAAIERDVEAHAQGQPYHDDRTLVVVKRVG